MWRSEALVAAVLAAAAGRGDMERFRGRYRGDVGEALVAAVLAAAAGAQPESNPIILT